MKDGCQHPDCVDERECRIHNNWSSTEDYFCKEFKITKNKFFEVQIGYWTNNKTFFHFDLHFNHWSDHAGVMFHLQLWKYFVILNLFDWRHWNYDTGTWENWDVKDRLS